MINPKHKNGDEEEQETDSGAVNDPSDEVEDKIEANLNELRKNLDVSKKSTSYGERMQFINK